MKFRNARFIPKMKTYLPHLNIWYQKISDINSASKNSQEINEFFKNIFELACLKFN